MKYVRNTLLMILIAALMMPAPSVWAESNSSDNTAEEAIIVKDKPDTLPSNSGDDLPPVQISQPETPGANVKIDEPDMPAAKKENSPAETNTAVDNSPAAPINSPEDEIDTASEIVISKMRLSPTGSKYIELYNPTNRLVNLAKWKLEYVVSSSGKESVLNEFAVKQMIAPGGFLVIVGADSTGKDYDVKSSSNWQNTPAKKTGAVRLVRPNGTKSDAIGWGKEAKDFEKTAAAGNKDILWRCFAAGVTVDSNDNAADFDGNDAELIEPRTKPNCPPAPEPPIVNPTKPDPPTNRCEGLGLSEVGANLDEQFIEIVNNNNRDANISGCKLATNRTKKPYVFGDKVLRAGEYLKVETNTVKLTLSKRSRGEVYLLDSAGNEIDTAAYEAMPADTSWSLIGGEWMKTYAPTPAGANILKEFADCKPGYIRSDLTGKCNKIPAPPALPAPCPAGQYRHPETGRCRKIAAPKSVVPCKEGYYRSEATGRCRSIAATAAKTLKPCAEGQFRNPATGRCKKIAAADDILKDCPEGFERNPTTRRCRKAKTASMPVVGSAAAGVKQVAGATWGWWVFGGVSLLAVGYGAWQWRWEVSQVIRKIRKTAGASRGK